MSEDTQPKSDSPQAEVNPTSAAEQKVFDWSKLIVAAGTALTGLLGTPYGIYVALGLAVVAFIAFFLLRGSIKNYLFQASKAQAGSKVGEEASQDQGKLDDNRNAVDDFLGRDRRS
jgi:hypothetical protein